MKTGTDTSISRVLWSLKPVTQVTVSIASQIASEDNIKNIITTNGPINNLNEVEV